MLTDSLSCSCFVYVLAKAPDGGQGILYGKFPTVDEAEDYIKWLVNLICDMPKKGWLNARFLFNDWTNKKNSLERGLKKRRKRK